MVGRNYRRTHSVYVYAYACIVHACAPLLHAYAPTLHSYASVFNSSYKCMPQHAYAYTGFAYICRYSETSFFVQFGFFFFFFFFHLFFLFNMILMLLFLSFTGFTFFHSQVGVVLVTSLLGTGP